jgi:lipopolysaccharide export system protein LptA
MIAWNCYNESEAAMKSNPVVSLIILLCFFTYTAGAWALSTDSQQPIEIEADFAELDDAEGKTVYIGNVVVTQGSIRMTGDKLRVNFTENRELEDVYLEGRPAYFKQTPDGADHDVEGEGLLIEYHAQENFLYLIDKAKLTKGDRLFEGHRINYDTEKSIITARSVPRMEPSGKAPEQPRRRVRIIIPPKKDAVE